MKKVKCKLGGATARHLAKCAEILTISKQEGNRGVSILSCYIGIPKQAIQNEHSQPCDITVVCQRDQFTINCLQREEGKARVTPTLRRKRQQLGESRLLLLRNMKEHRGDTLLSQVLKLCSNLCAFLVCSINFKTNSLITWESHLQFKLSTEDLQSIGTLLKFNNCFKKHAIKIKQKQN